MITTEDKGLPMTRVPTEPVTIRTTKETVEEIDALAAAMDRSRNYVINQALRQYLEANAWQVQRIEDGLAAAREGRVRPAEDVFADIAAKHGWQR
jgi:predicted transcriptional regulator